MSSIADAPASPLRLVMQDVHKRFGATVALGGVDLSVNAGEVLALVGENGAGKSTLMKVLSGALRPDQGQMWLDGKPYLPRSSLDARRVGVAMIYQELSLATHLSVMENVLLGLEPGFGPFINWGTIHERAVRALQELGHGDIDPQTPVSRLSIAQQQIVEIARAIAIDCRVLVLDEPTSSLTRSDIPRLFGLVRRLRESGRAIVYISHFLEEVKAISDRVTILRDGKTVGGSATGGISETQIITMMVGRTVDELHPRSDRKPDEVVLEIDRLAGKRGKPQSASLQLHRGEVFGIAGLVGSGRTELLRTVFGLDAVRSGQVKLGVYSSSATPGRRWSQGMGMVSEDRKAEGLALPLSISHNMTLATIPMWFTPEAQDVAATKWINRLGIRCSEPTQPVGDLSGGNQQKVAIARLLEHEVDVLLLDEPTRGIDVGSKAEIYRLIDQLACGGRAVLMVSSYLPELLGVCDRIAVMCRGVLGPPRLTARTSEHQIMLEATGTEISPSPIAAS